LLGIFLFITQGYGEYCGVQPHCYKSEGCPITLNDISFLECDALHNIRAMVYSLTGLIFFVLGISIMICGDLAEGNDKDASKK
jgi:hypothetical protein